MNDISMNTFKSKEKNRTNQKTYFKSKEKKHRTNQKT